MEDKYLNISKIHISSPASARKKNHPSYRLSTSYPPRFSSARFFFGTAASAIFLGVRGFPRTAGGERSDLLPGPPDGRKPPSPLIRFREGPGKIRAWWEKSNDTLHTESCQRPICVQDVRRNSSPCTFAEQSTVLKGPKVGPSSTKMAVFDLKGPFRGPVSTLGRFRLYCPEKCLPKVEDLQSRNPHLCVARCFSGQAAHPTGYGAGPAATSASGRRLRRGRGLRGWWWRRCRPAGHL